ncbi:hypothetical protein RYR42_002444 [Edwardsiella piscicida]|nr:hypothetical protein [Edwardsiella piscicida]
MEFTVSLSTIVTACLGFLGVYVLMPFALILRDFLLIEFVFKFILNERFWFDVRVVETDRATINYFYNKSCLIEFSIDGRESVCKIGDDVVSYERASKYQENRSNCINRMNAISERIGLRNSIAKNVFKYFKLSEYEGYVAKKAKRYYDQELELFKTKEKIRPSSASGD